MAAKKKDPGARVHFVRLTSTISFKGVTSAKKLTWGVGTPPIRMYDLPGEDTILVQQDGMPNIKLYSGAILYAVMKDEWDAVQDAEAKAVIANDAKAKSEAAKEQAKEELKAEAVGEEPPPIPPTMRP